MGNLIHSILREMVIFYDKILMFVSCFISSATWPYAVRRLAQSYLKEPMIVYVGTLDLIVSLFFITITKNISYENCNYFVLT